MKLAVYERYIIIYIYITDYPEYIAHHMRCSQKNSERRLEMQYVRVMNVSMYADEARPTDIY